MAEPVSGTLAALYFALKMFAILFGIFFLTWAFGQLPISQVLSSSLPAWPAAAVQMANYFGVVAGLQVMLSFIVLRVMVASIFAIARML